MRVLDVVCLLAAIGGAAYVYNVKHNAEIAHGTRQQLERDIAALSRDVGLLEADLAALEQPARLQAVINGLPDTFVYEPVAAHHYIRLEDIPFRSALLVEDAEGEEQADDEALPADDSILPALVSAPGAIDLLLQTLTGDVPMSTATAAAPVEELPADTFSTVDTSAEPIDGIGALLEDVVEITP